MAEIMVALSSDDQTISVPLATVFGTGIARIEQTVTSDDPEIPNEITCTLTNGQQSKFYIKNGKDGYSPSITIEQGAEGYSITVTDEEGSHEYSIIVDSTLDAESANPIQNQAVAGAVTQLTSDITAEVTRATNAESEIRAEASQVYATVNALNAASSALHDEVTGEYARATAVEEVLRTATTNNATSISTETSRAQAEEARIEGLTANTVKYTSQSLTDAQKTQARTNIGAITASEAPVQSVNGQTGAVTIPTATTSANGLMSSQDKVNLDAVRGQIGDLKSAFKKALYKYEFANDAVVNVDVEWTVGYMNTSGVTETERQRGIWSNMLTYQQLKNVVIDSTMKVRYAFYDASGTFVSMYYGSSPETKTFVKARAFVVPIRTDGNSNATDAEIQTALSTTIVITRDELQSAFARTSEIGGKVDKNGEDQVKPSNIDGSAYIATTITETITENSYWYATGSSTIASGGAMSGMDKAVFDISEMSGKIAFGFDAEASYGTGSFVIGVSSATESPYTRLAYFSKSKIPTSDYFEVDGNVAVLDLDALKETYSTAVTLFVNIPHEKWLLENRVYTKKALHWLLMSGAVPAIVVAKDGTGDYTTISSAVSHANNGDTIYIKDGEYKETVIVKKYIHLVGQSKQGTILYNDVGDYDNAPLLITQGSVCNMTVKSLAPADTSDLTDYAYAIHLDKNFASQAKYQKCEIYNCDIYSEVNDAIGAGTNYATEYDVHDCFLHVAHNPVKTGACGFKCHNGTTQTTGKVTLRNNIIITEDANGTSCYDILFHNGGISNTQPIEILQVGNVLKYYHNGITNIFVPSAYNYGNSVAEMNTLT